MHATFSPRFAITTLCLLCSLLFLQQANAAPPSFTVLPGISAGMQRPEDVAVAADLHLYVADAGRDQILIYNEENTLVGRIPVAAPSAVAVGIGGTVYAASNKDLSVQIFTASGQSIGFLGQGKNEFKLPRNIAIDPISGNVVVVDQLDNSIRIYEPSGGIIGRIDDTPNLPIDVAIHNGEIFVLDQPLIPDTDGNIRGARILIYDMQGNPTSYFGSFGTKTDQFVSPRALAVDSDGILYIADFFHGVIRSFDIWGNFKETIYDPATTLLSPKGITMDSNGRLAVASSLTRTVRFFSLPGHAGSAAPLTAPLADTTAAATDPFTPALTAQAPMTGTAAGPMASSSQGSPSLSQQDPGSAAFSSPASTEPGTAANATGATGGGQDFALYFPEIKDNDSTNLANIISVQNLADVGQTVTFQAWQPDGSLLATLDVSIAARGVIEVRPAGGTEWHEAGRSITGLDSFSGTLVIKSAQPVLATSSYQSSSANGASLAFSAPAEPMSFMLFPLVTDNIDGWVSVLSVQNIYATRQQMSITIYDEYNRIAGTSTFGIEPRARYEVRPAALINQEWAYTYNNGEMFIRGTVTVQSLDNPLPARILSRQQDPADNLMVYSSQLASTDLFFPINQDATDTTTPASVSFTDILVTSPTVQTIQVELYTYAGEAVIGSPFHFAFNTPFETLQLIPSQLAGLPAGSGQVFQGVMRVTGQTPLHGVSRVQQQANTGSPQATNLAYQFPAMAETELYFPRVIDGVNNQTAFLSIQNTTGAAHPVTVILTDLAGNSKTLTAQVPANGAALVSPSKDLQKIRAGSSFAGAIRIISEQPVTAALRQTGQYTKSRYETWDSLEIINGQPARMIR